MHAHRLRKSYRRVAKAYDRHGLFGFVVLAVSNLIYYARRAQCRRTAVSRGSTFDILHGTDTEGIREIGSLAISSRNTRYAVRYQSVDEELFAAIIAKLSIDFTRFTFVDFGSGKGKALLLASRHPFREIVGIEFALELHAIAEGNIARYGSDARRRRHVRSICSDVLDFEVPASRLVCYFYNPFGREVMQGVIEKLNASLRESPREVFVVYVDPMHQDLFLRSGKWKVRETGSNFIVFCAA